MPENADITEKRGTISSGVSVDYSHVLKPARIAIYDDPLVAPRVIVIEPATTTEFIQNIAVAVSEQVERMGGGIPYTIILEVTENFIHAQFNEVVVSVLDQGKTIRFTDQGPGIADGDKARRPGFTSASEAMKRYIRGVGSGLPIVSDWVGMKQGDVTIEGNLGGGAAVTISLVDKEPAPVSEDLELPSLTEREKMVLMLFKGGEVLGVTEISQLTGMGASSVFNQLKKLEDKGLVESTPSKKRSLTALGLHAVGAL